MTLLQHYLISLLLSTVVTWVLGIWIFLKQPHNKLARIFGLYALAVGYWTLCQAQTAATYDPRTSLVWVRAMFHAVVAFPVLLTHLFSTFLDIRQRKILRVGWVSVAILYPFLCSEWFLRAGGPVGFLPTMPKAGGLFLVFNLVWFAWSAYNMYLLGFRKPGPASSATRPQIRLLLFAFLFGYATGSVNYLYLYGIYVPLLQPFATYGVTIAFLVIAYGIFAYGLFDISVVIKKSLVYSLLITLLTAGYFGLVYGVERILQVTLGYRTMWVSLSAFGLMALAFQPLKGGLQRIVDWLIFKAPQEELARRMEKLEEQVLQAEKFKAVSTLAAGMAHEIKNPLTTLMTFTEFIPEKQNDPSFLRNLHEVYTAELGRIHQIVKDLLEFSKPKTPRMKLVDLGPLITSTINMLSNDLLKRHVEWAVDSQHNGVTLHADPDQLRQVLINLIQNAADAMPSGGQLKISTQAVNSHLELTVSDTGSGIPSALLPKIFDPFVTTKPDGNGLGLAMVYSILQAHRGSIRADSQPNRGTTFTVSLPL